MWSRSVRKVTGSMPVFSTSYSIAVDTVMNVSLVLYIIK